MNSLSQIFSLARCKTQKYFIFTSPVTLAALAGHKKGGRGVFMEGRRRAEEHKSQRSIKNPRSCYLRNTITKCFWKWAMPVWDTTRAGPEWTKTRMNKNHRSSMVSELYPEIYSWNKMTTTSDWYSLQVLSMFWWCLGCSCKATAFLMVLIMFWGCRSGSLSIKYSGNPEKCCIFMTLLILTLCSHAYNNFSNKYFLGTQDYLENALKVGM